MNGEKNKLVFLLKIVGKIIFLKFAGKLFSPYLCRPKN